MLNIVLYQPEIPQNTGNISRTAAATRTMLHIVKPMGFSLDEKHVRRAGLDYWPMVQLRIYEDWADFCAQNPEARPYLFTTKGNHRYTDVNYRDGDYLMFGPETRGLPEDMLRADPQRTLRLPMRPEARSLNLSNSVAVAVFEALRQLDFPDLKEENPLKPSL